MAHGRPALPARLTTPTGRTLSNLLAFSLAISSGAGLLAGAARASDLPRVLVLPYAPLYDGLPASSGEKAAEVLSNELKSSEQLQLVPLKIDKNAAPVKKATNPGPAKDAAAQAEARERAGKAEELTKKLKFREAATELEKVISLLEGQHPYIDFGDLVGAYLGAAVAYFRLGQDTEGEKALAHVVRLDPERKLDAEKYPPVFIRAFENVTKKVRKAPKAAIEVKPTMAGAPVYLDGREVGRAPLLIKDVIKGTHFLRIGEGWANKVEVPQGDTLRVSPDLGSTGGPLQEILSLLARNTLDELAVSRIAALAEQAPADFIVLGGVHKEGDAIVVSSHLMKLATRKTCLLQRVVFDQEMLGAGIEIYKVGTDITNKLDVFGDEEKLPAKVARDALPPSGTGSTLVAVSATGTGTGDKPTDSGDGRVVRKPSDKPVVEKPEKPADVPVVKTDVRKVTATSGEPEMIPLEPSGPGEEPTKAKPASKAWIWILVAVVAVGGIATGTYFTVDAANKPVTGKGTITW